MADAKKESIAKKIERLSKAYTPEWKYDPEHPDAASVIALIFAKQMEDNASLIESMPIRYQEALLSMYGMKRNPGVPSCVIGILEASGLQEGGYALKKGSPVRGENETGERILFTSAQDAYVTDAKITHLLSIDEKAKRATSVRGSFVEAGVPNGRIVKTGESFRTEGSALLIETTGLLAGEKIQIEISGEQIDALLAQKGAYTLYWVSEDSLCPVSDYQVSGTSILIRKEEGASDKLLIVWETHMPDAAISGILIHRKHTSDVPDFLYREEHMLNAEKFLPFGEELSLYQSCYIGHKLLLLPGEEIVLEFDLDFGRFYRQEEEKTEDDLRIVKRRPKRKPVVIPPDCWILESGLEYFNGKGWKGLECSIDFSPIFSSEENKGHYSISFRVPGDIEPTLQGAVEENVLRIQIKRADHAYLQNSVHHYPVLSHLRLERREEEKGRLPKSVQIVTPMEAREVLGLLGENAGIPLFPDGFFHEEALLIGFDRKPVDGPIGLFADVLPCMDEGNRMAAGYFNGKRFSGLPVMDETDAFCRPGLVSFLPQGDMARTTLYGADAYWILLKGKASGVRNILRNAVILKNEIRTDEQDFYLDEITGNMSFPISGNQMISVDVWVNEKDRLSKEEMEQMLASQPDQVRAEYHLSGTIEDFFVKWKEVPDFSEAKDMARVYRFDPGEKRIYFGDGVHAAIPGCTNGIAFSVSVLECDGAAGNIAKDSLQGFVNSQWQLDGIYNPAPAYGGEDVESKEHSLLRGSFLLSSYNRLISRKDFEREARLLSPFVLDVVCRAEQDGLVLAVLMEDYMKGEASFRLYAKKLKEHLIRKSAMIIRPDRIHIRRPDFVEISIVIWLKIPSQSVAGELRNRYLEAIRDYLEIDRKGSLWHFGMLPREGWLRTMIDSLHTSATVLRTQITGRYIDQNGHVREADLDRISAGPYMICKNGTHRIIMEEA